MSSLPHSPPSASEPFVRTLALHLRGEAGFAMTELDLPEGVQLHQPLDDNAPTTADLLVLDGQIELPKH